MCVWYQPHLTIPSALDINIHLHLKSSADASLDEGAPDLSTRAPAAVVDTGGGRHVGGLKPLGPPAPLLGKHPLEDQSLSSCRVIIFHIDGHVCGWMPGGWEIFNFRAIHAVAQVFLTDQNCDDTQEPWHCAGEILYQTMSIFRARSEH